MLVKKKNGVMVDSKLNVKSHLTHFFSSFPFYSSCKNQNIVVAIMFFLKTKIKHLEEMGSENILN